MIIVPTLLEAQNSLFKFFQENNLFDVEKDWDYVQLADTDDLQIIIKDICRAALEDFKQNGVVVELANGKYVLSKPLAHFAKSVEIPPVLATNIANIINTCSGENSRKCNAMDITSLDVQDIVVFLLKLLEKDDE